ncbi:MAG: hypothetical protein AAGD25_00270 [Cyanobacteria bacterium P01_F01_bin.150]
MVQVNLATSTNFSGDANAVIEDQGNELTFEFSLDEAAPAGGLKVYVDSNVPEILNRFNLLALAFDPSRFSNLTTNQESFTDFSNSGFSVTINAGATEASVTIPIFDTDESIPDPFFPETYDGLTTTTFTLKTRDQIDSADETSPRGSTGNDLDSVEGDGVQISDYTIGTASSTVLIADTVSQLPGPVPTDGYDEAVSGDISNDPSSPLSLPLAEGTTSLSATTGNADQEYVTVTVPDGFELESLVLESYSPSDVSFIGVQEGTTFTEPLDNSATLSEFLGYTLFGISAIGTDILDNIGNGSNGANFGGQGFEGPLPSGDYTFAIQQLGGPSDYELSFNIAAVDDGDGGGDGGDGGGDGGDGGGGDGGGNDGPPVVSFEVVPNTFSEESANNLVEWKWTVTGEFPEDGLIVNLDTSGGDEPFAFTGQFAAQPEPEFINADIVDFDFSGRLNIQLSEPEASFKLYFIDDIIEEGTQTFEFRLVDGEGYTVDSALNGSVFTITDDNGGPGFGPTVGLSVSETDLAEGDPLTVTFTTEGDIPDDGVQVLVQSDVFGALGQFELADLNNITTTGIAGLPEVGDGGGSSFLVTITDPIATIDLSVFDDILSEDPLDIAFTLANGEEYEVDPDAAGVTLTISDEVQPAGPTVGLSVDKTTVVEGEALTLTIAVDGEIPPEGLQVLINDVDSVQNQVRSLTEFDIASVQTEGIDGFPIPAEGDSGFFVTVTEPTATITLNAFDEGADEDEAAESFTFAVIDGEAYEVDPDASGVTVNIVDVADASETPVVTLTVTPLASEDDNQTITLTFNVEGEIPTDGLPITIEGDFLTLFDPQLRLLNQNIPLAIEPATGLVPIANRGSEFDIALTAPEVTVSVVLFDDILEEEALELSFAVSEGDGYIVGGDGPATVTIVDGDSVTPGSGPTVSLSVTNTSVAEGDELTVNFDVDGAIPDSGLTVFVDGPPAAIGEFAIFDENNNPLVTTDGVAGFPVPDNDAGGFFVTLVEEQASLTLSVFEDGPGEGEESLTFDLIDGEAYEVLESASSVDLTITNDTPEGTAIVGVTLDPAVVSEEGDAPAFTATFTVTNAEIPPVELDADGNYVSGGLSVFVNGGLDIINIFDDATGLQILDGIALGSFFDPEQPGLVEFILLEPTSTATLNILNDVIEEGNEDFTFSLVNDDAGVLGSSYAVSPDAASITVTIADDNGGPGVGPTVGITVTDTELVEGEEFTLNFTLEGDDVPSADNPLTVLVDSPTFAALGEFLLFDENGTPLFSTTGIDGVPVVGDTGASSFLVDLIDSTASITLSVFDDGPDEGLETLTFDVVNGEEYEVSETNSSVTVNINDAESTLPVVSFVTTTPVVTEDEQPVAEFVFTIDGDIPDDDQGLVVTVGGDGIEKLFAPRFLDGSVPLAFDPADGVIPIGFTGTEVILGFTASEVTSAATIFNDIVEEESDVLTFEILPADGYTIGQGTASVTVEDGPSATPGEGPTVSLSVSDSDLFEGDEFTVNITVDETTGAIPEGGLELFIDGGPTDLGEFNIFGENGIDPDTDLVGLAGFPEQGDDLGGFFVTVVEPQASITLSVFEDGPTEGQELLTFELANGELYEVAADAGSVDLTINDGGEDAVFAAKSGVTSVFLDFALLEDVAGLTLVSADSDAVPATRPSFLDPFQVGFAITDDTDFTFAPAPFTPLGGTIEHSGTITLGLGGAEATIGEFSIGFDPARASDTASGFFVADTLDDALGLEVLFDISAPGTVITSGGNLEISAADLLLAPELAGALGLDDLAGADVGDAQIDAVVALTDAPAPSASLDFEGDALEVGDVVTDQFDGLTIAVEGELEAMIFDTANPTGGDYDLRSDDLGQVLIISEDGDSADPDDNIRGGTLMFNWDGGVSLESIGLLDIEESGGVVTIYGEDDMTVLATVDIPGLENNSYQSLSIGTDAVGKIDVSLVGSGAITEIILGDTEAAS